MIFSLFFFPPASNRDDGSIRRSLRRTLRTKDAELPSTHPDWSIVNRVRRGDPGALDELVREYFTPLARFAVHITGSYESAEDAAQTVFLRVWDRRAEWAPVVGVRAYLFGSVRNVALNTRKSDAAAARRGERFVRELPVQTAPVEPDDQEEDRQRLRGVLIDLTERQRDVLRLRYEQQLSARDIATVLGVSTRAVERMLARTLTRLRDIFAP